MTLKLHPSVEQIIREKMKSAELIKVGRVEPKKDGFKLRKVLGDKSGRNLKLIAEFKRASPSKGWINPEAKLTKYVKIYDTYADAVSILTEEKFFRGSVEFVREARKITARPILAKDFFVDERQVKQALVAGADAVLIVRRVVDLKQAKNLYSLAESLGLDSIVEVHSPDEAKEVLDSIDPAIIGINTRNFEDLSIHPEVIDEVVKVIPESKIIIAESGVSRKEDLERIKGKVNAVLIGTAIMKAENPEEFLKEMVKWLE